MSKEPKTPEPKAADEAPIEDKYHGYTPAQIARIEAEKDPPDPVASKESAAVKPDPKAYSEPSSTAPAPKLTTRQADADDDDEDDDKKGKKR